MRLTLALLTMFPGSAVTQNPSGTGPDLLAPGKTWELLGEGYQLTADSAVDRDGIVYITDARRDRILKIDLDGKVTVWKSGTNRTHGVTMGADGRLYGGQHDLKRLVALAPDGTESAVISGVSTHHLTATTRNEIYFTEAPMHKVWRAESSGSQRVVHEGIRWPRGVRATSDRRFLAVGDGQGASVWRFDIQEDGSLKNGQPFYRLRTRGGSKEVDAGGLDFDTEGFLYVASNIGVQVCDTKGEVIDVIETPGTDGANNVFFAGPKLQWLYVATWDKIYRRPANRQGRRP